MTIPEVPVVAYGLWPSSLTPAVLFENTETISWLRPGNCGIFFVQSMPEENNALVLMHRADDSKVVRVSPSGMNLRSQVQEYGGVPFTFTDELVFYCNFADQRVYRQPFDQRSQTTVGQPEPMTPADDGNKLLRYADFEVDARRQRLICVREDHRSPETEPRNSLVALGINAVGEGEILFGSSDFVASPRISPDGNRLVFQSWSHPNMPWDNTQIRLATFEPDGKLREPRSLFEDKPGAFVQPAFSPHGDLFFIVDWSDWWNLYRVDAAKLDLATAADAAVVLAIDAEACSPQWVLGQRTYAFVDENSVLLALNRQCAWQLALVNWRSDEQKLLQDGLGKLEHVFCYKGSGVFFAASATDDGAIHSIELRGSTRKACVYRGRAGGMLDDQAVSCPQHISFATGSGQHAFTLYYPPRNPSYQPPPATLPPLLVRIHGGPTSSANSSYSPAVQFWTSRGFALLDVNHRGSTGYGRRFRHSLYREWGVADVEDVINAATHMVETGRADPARIAIRGASAGGYVVLAALAASKIFSAGASYYGIGDLELLVKDTHKFESRYLDQLIGPYPEMASVYRARSPLHHIDAITAPVLLLQGMQDKVVPPNQAANMYSALKAKNPLTRCVYFEEEGHGFRKPQNQVAALEAELAFYSELFL